MRWMNSRFQRGRRPDRLHVARCGLLSRDRPKQGAAQRCGSGGSGHRLSAVSRPSWISGERSPRCFWGTRSCGAHPRRHFLQVWWRCSASQREVSTLIRAPDRSWARPEEEGRQRCGLPGLSNPAAPLPLRFPPAAGDWRGLGRPRASRRPWACSREIGQNGAYPRGGAAPASSGRPRPPPRGKQSPPDWAHRGQVGQATVSGGRRRRKRYRGRSRGEALRAAVFPHHGFEVGECPCGKSCNALPIHWRRRCRGRPA